MYDAGLDDEKSITNFFQQCEMLPALFFFFFFTVQFLDEY